MLAEADVAHGVCVARSKDFAPPFVTCWAVLAEAAWLLRRVPENLPKLMDLISSGLIVCPELDANAAPMIAEFARTYADLRPELADLTLLYLAERDAIEIVFTLDRRDFAVYRTRRGQPLQLVPIAN